MYSSLRVSRVALDNLKNQIDMAPAKATIAQPKLPSFVTTPSELQAAVVSHILNPHDLKCLRLVCEQADALASAELYREVAIDLLKLGDNPLFVEGRSAHKCVRQISFNVSDQSPHFSHDAARRDIRSLLFLLPRNKMKKILHTYTPTARRTDRTPHSDHTT